MSCVIVKWHSSELCLWLLFVSRISAFFVIVSRKKTLWLLLLNNRSQLLILVYLLMYGDFCNCPEIVVSKQYSTPNITIYSLNTTVYWNCNVHCSFYWCEISVLISLLINVLHRFYNMPTLLEHIKTVCKLAWESECYVKKCIIIIFFPKFFFFF